MAADVLATQGAMTSATMILTNLDRDNSIPALDHAIIVTEFRISALHFYPYSMTCFE